MNVRITTDLIPKGRRNRPGTPLDVQYVTIHHTANTSKGANRHAHARYLKGDAAVKAMVSWHYTVDSTGATKHLPLSEQGYHAGKKVGNETSIGIEICEHAGQDFDKAYTNAAELAAFLLRHYKLPIERLVMHRKFTGKLCPGGLIEGRYGWTWGRFVERVKDFMEEKANGEKSR